MDSINNGNNNSNNNSSNSNAISLQFQALNSAVETTFWHVLSQKKLHIYKLDDSLVPLEAYTVLPKYSKNNSSVSISSRFYLTHEGFENTNRFPIDAIPMTGQLKNTNSIEEFRQINKEELLSNLGKEIWNSIQDHSDPIQTSPHLLSRFLLVTFANLKSYKYFHWFAFPAFAPAKLFQLNSCTPFHERFPDMTKKSLQQEYEKLKGGDETIKGIGQCSFFLVKQFESQVEFARLSEWTNISQSSNNEDVFVGFSDPCSLDTYPGWPLRNFLVYIKKKWKLKRVQVLCYRESQSSVQLKSIILTIDLGDESFEEMPKVVGWEKNSGKNEPKEVDLAALMDPKKLAETAVDLNLQLMRWRIMPNLNLPIIKSTKCLLLGSGTLGCFVSRSLMAWGVRTITLVDSGKVSYSNPVRQPLFTFEDCMNGGKPKALAASEALMKIFPGMNAKGVSLYIPMPGHPISESEMEKSAKDISTLEAMIKEHDTIFLLTDSRESRWLPTMLGSFHGKIVINAALGFDSYLVMRHGVRSQLHEKPSLGCYFCNDVVSPTDSLKDRTLDQQCTVTRPGASPIAAALSVELLVSLLNHPLCALAPADTTESTSNCELGLIPHQIRGFLGSFSNILITGQAYDLCPACSTTVLGKYEKEGFEFLVKVFNEEGYLNKITGLDLLHKQTESLNLTWDDEEDQFID